MGKGGYLCCSILASDGPLVGATKITIILLQIAVVLEFRMDTQTWTRHYYPVVVLDIDEH